MVGDVDEERVALLTLEQGIANVKIQAAQPRKMRDLSRALAQLHEVWSSHAVRSRPGLHVQALASLSRAHRMNGSYDLAIKFSNALLRASKEATSGGDRDWQTRIELLAHGGLTLSFLFLGDGVTALAHAQTYTVAAAKLKNPEAIGRGMGNEGCCYQLLGDLDAAMRCHRRRRQMAQEMGDRAAEGRSLGNLGVCHMANGKPKQAAMHFRDRLKLAQEICDADGIQSAYHNLGVLAVQSLHKGETTVIEMEEAAGDK